MKYYFTLSKENVKNFYSSNWIVLGKERVFGGGVIIITPNDIKKLFRCTLLRSSDSRTLFEIDLPEGDIQETVVSAAGCITLVKLTNDKTGKDWTCTLLHRNTGFFDLTPNGYSLKGMLPITKPGWSWDIKPFSMKTTVDSGRDFIPPYPEADSKINMMEVLTEMSMFESDKRVKIPEIKEVIFNKPATVVYWKDGTKTIVKCGEDEHFDHEKAVAMCFLKKMFKPSIKSHWLDVIHDAINAAIDKKIKIADDRFNKANIKAENIAKAEEARRKKAEKKAAALKNEIQTLEKKDNTSNKELFETIKKENNNKVVLNKNGGVKIDQDLFLECVKENLTIDEIAEMNSWSKAAVARMYYKVTGKHPEKKNNTYSELDELFEKGVSVDAAARRTGFAKNIVAMRYAKLQNKKN